MKNARSLRSSRRRSSASCSTSSRTSGRSRLAKCSAASASTDGAIFFGIIAHDELYLKVEEGPDGEANTKGRGCIPTKSYPNRPTTMKYYAVPVGVLESGVELTRWAQKAVEAAARAK